MSHKGLKTNKSLHEAIIAIQKKALSNMFIPKLIKEKFIIKINKNGLYIKERDEIN
jgi:hypothetical protein